MNLSELKTEFYARGADYLSEDGAGVTRAERWLNQAYREICGLHAWPFLEDEASGTPPLSIPTLRRVRFVRATAKPWHALIYTTEDELVQDGLDLTQTGTPEYYYIKGASAVHTAPDSTESIDVGFTKRVAPMTGTDEPLFDEEYHNLIVDRAVIKMYQDADEFEAAVALREEFNNEVQGMAEDYQVVTRDVFYMAVENPTDG
jgi:hypothetical protein